VFMGLILDSRGKPPSKWNHHLLSSLGIFMVML
jgi:hypothetical protein